MQPDISFLVIESRNIHIVEVKDLNIHATLVEECKMGNRKAQFRLYNQYSRAMYNLAYRMTGNREDAEDILQETFVECFRNLNSFRYKSTFGAWLKTILINRSINHLRKRRIPLVYDDNIPDNITEDEPDVILDNGRIIKAIEMLPDGYRIILTLYLLEGYDHSEIAQIMGITESTSKSQYSRAKNRLRNMITKKN
jgi:RNA polymerase sigma factor (sigma-70 family)